MIFGKNGCSNIEVQPLSPICTIPSMDRTTPLTLDVPVPAFVNPVIPSECVCLDFVSENKETIVSDRCSTGEAPKCSVEIVQDGDCCGGRYKITPHVEIPCMPFTVESAEVNVHDKDGGDNIDGTVSFSLDTGCCTLTPVLDVTMPKCIKQYEQPPAVQISYTDHGVPGKTHQLVSLVENRDECTVYPKINPLTLPCPVQNYSKKYTADLSEWGGKLTVTEGITDCVPFVTYSVTPVPAPTVSMCMAAPNITYKIRYTDSNGEEHTEDTSKTLSGITVEYDSHGCPFYKTANALTLDIGTIKTGTTFANGGGVNLSTGNKLQVDGTPDSGETWYGGGCGDIGNNNKYTEVVRRGPAMRNNSTSPGKVGTTYYEVPMSATGAADSRIVNSGGTQYAKWDSGRSSATASASATATTEDPATTPWNWEAGDANLNIIWPTAAQWHNQGVALVMTEFQYNQSGVLSFVKETQKALLVSPSHAVKNDTTSQANVSGLRIFAESEGRRKFKEATATMHGLRVNAGDGLRIYGTGETGIVNSNDTYSYNNRQGALEIMYGKGFAISRVTGTQGKLEKAIYPVEAEGALELAKEDRDFDFSAANKLLITDKKAATANNVMTRNSGVATFNPRFKTDNAEIVVPVIIPSPELLYYYNVIDTTSKESKWIRLVDMEDPLTDKKYNPALVYNGGAVDVEATLSNFSATLTLISSLMGCMCVGYQHISTAGTVIGIDKNPNQLTDEKRFVKTTK